MKVSPAIPLTGVRTPRSVLYMNTNTATFTAADVAAFAELIRPTVERVTTDGLSLEDAATAAAWKGQRDNTDEYARRMIHLDLFVGALAGTYDEFRTEAGL